MTRVEQTKEMLITTAQMPESRVCLWGTGVWGTGLGYQLMEWLEIDIDFYCDNNSDMWGKKIIGNIKCIAPNEIIRENNLIVFIMIGVFHCKEVIQQLEKLQIYKIVTLDDLVDYDPLLEKFYGVKNFRKYERKMPIIRDELFCDRLKCTYQKENRIAIYTCIVNDYDEVLEPLKNNGFCDFFLISDKKPRGDSKYNWIHIEDVVPIGIHDPVIQNRYCKMHSKEIFTEYRYSIYVDGDVELINDISQYIWLVGKSGLAMHRHGFMNCLYSEGMRMVGAKRADYSEVKRQMLTYRRMGMPRCFGQFECGVIVRDHTNSLGDRIMNEWYEELKMWEKRDQFSFTYVLWKNGIPLDWIGCLNKGKEKFANKDMIWRRHKKR